MTRLAAMLALALSATSAACGAPAPEAEEPVHDPLRDVDAQTLFQRATELAERGDFVRSEQYMRAAVAKGYSEERAIHTLLRMYMSTSRLRAAIDLLEPYLENHPEKWRTRYLVATLYLGIEQPDKAALHLERTVADRPTEPEPVWTLAIIERDHRRRPERAITLLRRYLELSPTGVHATDATRSIDAGAPAESVAPMRLDPAIARDASNDEDAR